MISVPVIVGDEVKHFPADYREIDVFHGLDPKPHHRLREAVPQHPDYTFFQTPPGQWYGFPRPSDSEPKMNPYTIIFHGEDGEPDIWVHTGKSPRHAVLQLIGTWTSGQLHQDFRSLKRFFRLHLDSLHGVYPGSIGQRVYPPLPPPSI